QTAEPEVWNWFSSHRVRAEVADATRLELLKTTYRMEPGSVPRLHELAHEVSGRLGMDGPITFYQSQGSSGLNASLAFMPDETLIVLQGPILDVLSEQELKALLGHEFAHRLLWTGWGGNYLIADQILIALANDPGATLAHCETARLFRLYT